MPVCNLYPFWQGGEPRQCVLQALVLHAGAVRRTSHLADGTRNGEWPALRASHLNNRRAIHLDGSPGVLLHGLHRAEGDLEPGEILRDLLAGPRRAPSADRLLGPITPVDDDVAVGDRADPVVSANQSAEGLPTRRTARRTCGAASLPCTSGSVRSSGRTWSPPGHGQTVTGTGSAGNPAPDASGFPGLIPSPMHRPVERCSRVGRSAA
jgi:hypothetical protein